MGDMAVVALEEVLADDLPVRLGFGLPAGVVDERVDVEAKLGDLRRQRAEGGRERPRGGRRVGEDERPPGADCHWQKAELLLREAGLLLAARGRAQPAVEAVRPFVVGALQRLRRALYLGDDVAPVAADVDE